MRVEARAPSRGLRGAGLSPELWQDSYFALTVLVFTSFLFEVTSRDGGEKGLNTVLEVHSAPGLSPHGALVV